MESETFPGRKSLRLPGYDYTLEGAMALSEFGRITREQWLKLPQRFPHIELGEYAIMPNHMHGIIIINNESRGTAGYLSADFPGFLRRAPTSMELFVKPVAGSIPTIVRSYKSVVALRINLMRRTKGVPVWQRNYYEHNLRNNEDYLATSTSATPPFGTIPRIMLLSLHIRRGSADPAPSFTEGFHHSNLSPWSLHFLSLRV